MKVGFVLGGIATAAAALVVYKRSKKKNKKGKKKKSNKKRKSKRNLLDTTIPEKRLKDYPLKDRKRLNNLEKIFLSELTKSDPEGRIKVKQREPIINEEGFVEYAYLIQYPTGERFMITPKIDSQKDFWFAMHEVCHDIAGHQDELDPDYYISSREKEYQVEDCLIEKSIEYEIPYKPRTRREIRRAYG